MAKVLVNTETLTSIADAIREKTGTTETLKPGEMADAISSIVGDDLLEAIVLNINEQDLSNEQAQYIIDTVAAKGSSFKKLRDYLFLSNDTLTKIVIPEGIKTIGKSCFDGCWYLNDLTIANTVRIIKERAFAVTNIAVLRLPSSLEQLEKDCLTGTYTSKVYFNSTPTKLDAAAFSGTSIKDIYVPWAEGAVANAPWGADNATVHYNYTE